MLPKCTTCWIKLYGFFLIAAGFAGWLSNPEKAQTALISGATFGTLALALGFVAATGRRWALWATLGVSAMLGAVFTIRSLITWRAYSGGNEDKLFAACLITSMLVATLALIPIVIRELRAPRKTTPAS
jgi:uncharacterized membrane protein (UPF0136 family)